MKNFRLVKIGYNEWMRGLSRQTTSIIGGLFRQASNFDPFEKSGIMQPSFTPVAATGLTLTANRLTPFSIGGVGYLYAHGTTKLYQINTNTQAGTDVTGNITAGAVKGAGVWRGRYLYVLDTEVRSIVLNAGTDASVLAGLTSGVPHEITTGPDLNQYVTNGINIARLILESGTTGNTTSSNIVLEVGQYAKDLASDGRNLVIVSDDNLAQSQIGKGKCVVTYWDCAKTTAEAIYELEGEAYVIAVKVIGDTTLILGYNGIYIGSVNSKPKLLFPFIGNSTVTNRPNSPSQVMVKQGVLHWLESGGTNVFAYGNPLDDSKKIIYNPYTGTGSGNGLALCNSGFKIWAALDTPGIYVLNSGSTRGSADIYVSPMDFESRYKFGFIKVVLNGLLSSGESITCQVISRDATGIIINTTIKNFTTDANRQVLIFDINPAGGGSDVNEFEELYWIYIGANKRAIKRVELWAKTMENQYQTE